MAWWQQFLVIAGAHFLALLSPGPDFFLIVRSALVNGVRQASGVCVGIALANAIYIVLAISGVAALHALAGLFVLLKWAGCAYLAWLGCRFLVAGGASPVVTTTDGQPAASGAASWWRECRTGFLSGILNPKNSLFYASLFSLGFGPGASLLRQAACGVWMATAVLVWDLAVARAAGHPPIVRRFMARVRQVERVTGVVLLTIAIGIVAAR